MGFGPSAHSFDGLNRSWNHSSLKGYVEGVNREEPFSETEYLSKDERYHDYLITTLRTKWGCDPTRMEKKFGLNYREHFEKKARPYLEAGTLYIREGRIAIHPDSWLIADHILRELFVD